MGRTLSFFVAFLAIIIVQVKCADSENTNASHSWFQSIRDRMYTALNIFGTWSSSSKSLKISDIGSNWVYLEGSETRVQCTDESGSFYVPGVISLTFNHTYTCTIEGSVESGITFTPGAGNFTNFDPRNGTVVAHFEDEEENCVFRCDVYYNRDIQTDTVWNLVREGEHQTINNSDHLFEISGDQHPHSESNFGNRLKIRNCSSERLNGAFLYCGSHANPEQAFVTFKVCEKPNVTINDNIWLAEGTKGCTVAVIRSPIKASRFIWHKNEEVINEYERYLVSGEGVTFNDVEKGDIGHYSITAYMSCDESSNVRKFIGNFSLNVTYGPSLTKADEAYLAHKGQSVTLTCGRNLNSNPTANISWTNPEGETIVNSEKFAMNNVSEEVSLTITGVSEDDNGNWTCTVEVPRKKPLYCSSEEENRPRVEHHQLQLTVVIPPSEPLNVSVVEVSSTSFRICWDEPEYHGSPNLADYSISYGDHHESVNATIDNCFSSDNDNFEWGDIYNISVFAVITIGNETIRGNSSQNVTLIIDRPAQLRIVDISSSQVTLTWDKLSDALPNQQYNIYCNGTAQGTPTTDSSYVIPGLSPSTTYNCTVVGHSETSHTNSLRSFEVLFVPGAGEVTRSVPDSNTVIAHFEDEGESCSFICEVQNNGTQTDTVWSFENGSAVLEKITGGHISGDYRPGSQSHYSNHLQIIDCSLRELDGVIIYCGSHVNLKQAFFRLKVCELQHQITPSVIKVIEGTNLYPITVVCTNLKAMTNWKKNRERVREEVLVDGFTITFNNVERTDAGNYSITSSVVCHDDKTKQITGEFALDVIYPPTITMEGKESHKVNETEAVTLICGLQSNPRASVTWIAPNGTAISDKEGYSQDDGPDVQLHIRRADRNDRGQWTCNMDVPDINICVYSCLDDKKVLSSGHDGQQPQTECSRHSFNKTSINIHLDVFYGPDIKSENLTLQSSALNEMKVIICARGLESNPAATITWTNPAGEIVKNGTGYSYESPINGSRDVTLTITSVNEKDYGTWNCTILVKDGENKIGREDFTFKLHIGSTSVDPGRTYVLIRGIIIIVGTAILGTTIIIAMQKLKVAKASKPTVPESAITKPQTSDKIPYTSQITHSSVTSTQRSHDDTSVEDDPILTDAKVEDEAPRETSLAETLRSQSKRITSSGSHPDIYCPIKMKLDGAITKCIITVDPNKSIDEFWTPMNERVLMLVGPTGAGKSTLINGIANYIVDVCWQDDFRFKVIIDEGETSQAHSQTSKITAYTFHSSRLPYTLTMIDTPGFGDTRGIESDKIIVEQIRTLFSVGGIDQIHGIGFVTDASSARLTPTMQYVFDSVLSIFGKDIASNIFLLLTFSDGQEPPVLSAIKEAAIPYKADFKFNNSALFVKYSTGTFDEMFWRLGMENFDKFFREFELVEPHSLHLTRENLNERQHLEAVIEGLKMQIRVVLAKIDMLRQKQYILRKREAEILQNQHFTYEATVSKQRRIELPKHVFVTNCNQCEFTCHYPCPVSKDNEKYQCKAMDGGGPDSARCTVCPGNCPWSQHINATYRFETYYEIETQTSDDLKKNLFEAIEGKGQIESMIADIEEELEMLQGVIVGMVSEAKRSLERLQDIALKPNPLSEIEYIDLLIKAENSEKSPGFTERIKVFEMIKDIVKTQGAVASGKKTDSMWWKNLHARK